MKLSNQLIREAGFIPTRYSSVKDPVILFMALDRQDNNKFISKITSALYAMNIRNEKITPTNLSRETKYSIREIELNLQEIQNIMDTLGIE